MSQPTQATAYEAAVVRNTVNMLALSPTFQSLLPPAADPKSYIIESWGGTIDWTAGPLEKKVDKLADGAHEDFRLFLSAEPPPSGTTWPLQMSVEGKASTSKPVFTVPLYAR